LRARLCTAVHNYCGRDVSPDELLSHLDELVARIDESAADGESEPVTGVTCLLAIYDPVSGHCTPTRARRGPPRRLRDLSRRPGLTSPPGLGAGLPIETAELPLCDGSRLALYTDGLGEDRDRDIDVGARPGPGCRLEADRAPVLHDVQLGAVADQVPLSWSEQSLDAAESGLGEAMGDLLPDQWDESAP
jgi:hypothetical protein